VLLADCFQTARFSNSVFGSPAIISVISDQLAVISSGPTAIPGFDIPPCGGYSAGEQLANC